MLSRTVVTTVIILGILVAGFVWWQMTSGKANEPAFTVLSKDQSIEIREYPPLIVAQVEVKGERYQAINAGFRILADYIFGNNVGQEKIAMTAPVIQEGKTIGMTAPVMQQLEDDAWKVRFVMPADFNLKTLPKPNNPDISFITLPKKKYVVIKFSGGSSDENLKSHLNELLAYISNHKIETTGQPIMAFYNPPWILPWLRRNEIMFEIK